MSDFWLAIHSYSICSDLQIIRRNVLNEITGASTNPEIILCSRALVEREYDSGGRMKPNLFLDMSHFPFNLLETELLGHQREVWHLSKGVVQQSIAFTNRFFSYSGPEGLQSMLPADGGVLHT